jgi:hypothetical protein
MGINFASWNIISVETNESHIKIISGINGKVCLLVGEEESVLGCLLVYAISSFTIEIK